MTTRALYLTLSSLCFDDAAIYGPYSLVYAPDTVGDDYATYTLYHRATYVTRWRVKTYTRLEAVRWQVVHGMAWLPSEWTFEEGGGFAFVSDEEAIAEVAFEFVSAIPVVERPRRKRAPVARKVKGDQLALWAA